MVLLLHLSMVVVIQVFFFYGYGSHRDLHVLTHSLPTRGSSDLYFDRAFRKMVAAFEDRAYVLYGSSSSSAQSVARSEEHTSELQSLMRISYAVFCVKKKNSRVSR